jgi:hypothetical protein
VCHRTRLAVTELCNNIIKAKIIPGEKAVKEVYINLHFLYLLSFLILALDLIETIARFYDYKPNKSIRLYKTIEVQ